MNFELEITFADGTTKIVQVKAQDIVAFEQHFDMSMADLEKNVRLTHLFFMGHSALKREGEKKSFDDWLAGVDMVQATDSKKAN